MITPVGGIQHKGKFHVFYSETVVGPVTRKLYNELTGIQFGDVEAPEGWIVKVEYFIYLSTKRAVKLTALLFITMFFT